MSPRVRGAGIGSAARDAAAGVATVKLKLPPEPPAMLRPVVTVTVSPDRNAHARDEAGAAPV